MNNLFMWAQKWGISTAAVKDLIDELGAGQPSINTVPGTSEAAIQSQVRLEGSRNGCRLYRNNVGACQDSTGRHIRYGIANESKKMNEHIKSSDLIGIRPVKITEDMVGSTIGQFMAREIKAGGWQYAGTDREQAQLRFLELICSLGGDACFANSVGSI